MDMSSDTGNLSALIDSTGNTLFDNVLRISLFAGAIFQLVCIFAVIFVPSNPSEEVDSDDDDDNDDVRDGTTQQKVKVHSSGVRDTGSATDQPKSSSSTSSNKTNKRNEKKKKR